MKICLILPNLLPVPDVKGGAIETLVTNIINENEKHNKINITVASIYDESAYQKSINYKKTKFIYIKKNLKYVLYSVIYKLINKVLKKHFSTYNQIVLSKIKKENYDYIIIEGGVYEGFTNYLKYFDKNKMVIHIHHNAESNKIIDQTFSKTITVSNFVAKTWENSSTIKNIAVLKNGIDFSKFDKSLNKIEFKKQLGFLQDDIIVMYCGRIMPIKGVKELVKSFKLINNPKLKLLIVGSINFGKNQENKYTVQINNELQEVKDRVLVTGYVKNGELYKYYKTADIFVVPSICEEAAGLVNIEAMYCSLPIIATNSGGMVEYLNNKCSIIVEKDQNLINNLKNAIEKLANDPELRKEMAINGEKEALNYTSEKYYNNFYEVLKGYGGTNE